MRKIIWTSNASSEYDGNIDYLIREWSEKEALTFIQNVDTILYNLKAGIVEYSLTDEDNVRKCVVCKQITLFYQINTEDDVELLSFWNTYQNNKKKPY